MKAYYAIRIGFTWTEIEGKFNTGKEVFDAVKSQFLVTGEFKEVEAIDWRRFNVQTEVALLGTNKRAAKSVFESLRSQAQAEKWLRDRAAENLDLHLINQARRYAGAEEGNGALARMKREMAKPNFNITYFLKWNSTTLAQEAATADIGRRILAVAEDHTEEEGTVVDYVKQVIASQTKPPRMSGGIVDFTLEYEGWRATAEACSTLHNIIELRVSRILDARSKLEARKEPVTA